MKLERMEEWQMLSHILILLKGCSLTVDDSSQFISDPSQIIALPCNSASPSSLVLNFVQIVGFVKVVTLIYLHCYMNLSNWLNEFVKVVTYICQSCPLCLSPFAKQS